MRSKNVGSGRLENLVPHILRGQFIRPGFVQMSLRLGVAQQMPSWAKLQFTHAGVPPEDLEKVLGRITSLETWVGEWEHAGRERERTGDEQLAGGERREAAKNFLAASALYNFAQYVMFLDIARKRSLHEACVAAYAKGAPYYDPPALHFDIQYRRRAVQGYLRLPRSPRPAPVVVIFNGTNAVKEELHWWSDALLEEGVATIAFDGPGLGNTFHRLTTVAEPRPLGVAILNHVETRPELDPDRIAILGLSLGGYVGIRIAAHDSRVRAVAAVSPPYSADIYWRVTLAALRNELAGLYGIKAAEMEPFIDRITLADDLPRLAAPLLVAGGGQDIITPGSEAWRIFEDARCERELFYYPQGAHDCFNVISHLRPRIITWLTRHLGVGRRAAGAMLHEDDGAWRAGEAVDPDFADDLAGEAEPRKWHVQESDGVPVRWELPWKRKQRDVVELIHKTAGPGADGAVTQGR
jgi:alpha-beta hydrolase superfamily lysophospholipase